MASPRTWLLTLGLAFSVSAHARADLFDYVKKPDDSYSWKLKDKLETPDGVVYNLRLVSQTWQGIVWEHEMQVFLPKGVKPGSKMLLWNQGGKSGLGSTVFGMQLAVQTQAPVALLFGIPNQPLLDGKREDALIAETFVRYLETRDGSWPLLFPMVKSLVKAMDALQEFAQREWGVRIEGFIVSGASKRGWTTWLTAAADARVKAIAPLVIDTLNMPMQLPHQLKSYGKYSEQIADYTKRGLVPLPDTAEARKLWGMVDPWNYRDKIKAPIMIINGANDPYWTVDSLNLYWDGLQGDKWVLYVPNAGHDLQQTLAQGGKSRDRAINTLIAFARHMIKDNPMPKMSWTYETKNGNVELSIASDTRPNAARLWVAEAPTRDFRKAVWREHRDVSIKIGADEASRISASVATPRAGYLAVFGELDFSVDGIRHSLSTQIHVVAAGAE
jgi:PhoPQ-activated pathogenicity-related protein